MPFLLKLCSLFWYEHLDPIASDFLSSLCSFSQPASTVAGSVCATSTLGTLHLFISPEMTGAVIFACYQGHYNPGTKV